MHINRLVTLLLAGLLSASSHAQSDQFEQLFDGHSLSGWEGNRDLFRVEEGAIVAGTHESEILEDEFLCAEQRYSDFELRLEARMTGGQYAGVQFRGERISGSTQVGGYQADMGFIPGEFMPLVSDVTDANLDDPYPLWGSLLDEYRPEASRYPNPANPYRLIAVADRKIIDQVLRPVDWNSVAIKAVGKNIEIYLNGAKTVEYVEEGGVPQSGLVCVQVHSGPASEAYYRNIRIRVITD